MTPPQADRSQARGRVRVGVALATCGYIGYAPIAPGTVGSAAGLALFALVRSANSVVVEFGVIAAVFLAGVWASTVAERHFGGTDPGPVVIDEVAGMLITLALVPVSLTGAIVGFLIFRLFDVVKPWPAGRFESLPGGLGVMADDGMAALYGNAVLRAVIAVAPAGWLT